jgi:hypothetical protein
MTKFVMLALVAFSLAACETATTDDVALRSDVGPTASHHQPMVRGPVVPDRVEPAARRTATAPRVARVVPNPLSQTATTGSTAAAPMGAHQTAPASAPQAAVPTEPAQSASTTEEPQPSETATAPLAPVDAVLMQDSTRTAETQPSAPIEFLPKDLTPEKIEAMFGGMPFLLIAAIAAALVASLGLALRRPSRGRNEYADHRDNVDHLDDHREPYAA